jgi:hypothetical protein
MKTERTAAQCFLDWYILDFSRSSLLSNLCLGSGFQGQSYSPEQPTMESHGGIISTGETEELRENPVPVPLCPPQILHGLTQVQTRASVERNRLITAWTMARPRCCVYFCSREFILYSWEVYVDVFGNTITLMLSYPAHHLTFVENLISTECRYFAFVCLVKTEVSFPSTRVGSLSQGEWGWRGM